MNNPAFTGLDYPLQVIAHLATFDMVFIPSAGGKTHLVSAWPNLFIDGDRVVADGPGWPKEKRWWEVLPAHERALVHSRNAAALVDELRVQSAIPARLPPPILDLSRELMNGGGRRTVLFNGDLRPFMAFPHFNEGVRSNRIAVFLPAEHRHYSYAALRRASGNTSQPADWPELRDLRSRLLTQARDLGLRIIVEVPGEEAKP